MSRGIQRECGDRQSGRLRGNDRDDFFLGQRADDHPGACPRAHAGTPPRRRARPCHTSRPAAGYRPTTTRTRPRRSRRARRLPTGCCLPDSGNSKAMLVAGPLPIVTKPGCAAGASGRKAVPGCPGCCDIHAATVAAWAASLPPARDDGRQFEPAALAFGHPRRQRARRADVAAAGRTAGGRSRPALPARRAAPRVLRTCARHRARRRSRSRHARAAPAASGADVSRPGLRQRSHDSKGAGCIASCERDTRVDLGQQCAFVVAPDAIAGFVEQALSVVHVAAEDVLARGEQRRRGVPVHEAAARELLVTTRRPARCWPSRASASACARVGAGLLCVRDRCGTGKQQDHRRRDPAGPAARAASLPALRRYVQHARSLGGARDRYCDGFYGAEAGRRTVRRGDPHRQPAGPESARRRLSARRRPAARRGHAAHAHAARSLRHRAPCQFDRIAARAQRARARAGAGGAPAGGRTHRAGHRRRHAPDERSRDRCWWRPRRARVSKSSRCPVLAPRSRRCRSPGLATDRFVFEGFLPAKATARREALAALAHETRTLVFYEAPHRLEATLQDLASVFGAEREAAVAREITKRFEHVYRGTLAALASQCATDANMTRGEIVLVVAGAPRRRGRSCGRARRGSAPWRCCCRNCRCRRPRALPRSSPAAAARNSTSARSRWRRRSPRNSAPAAYTARGSRPGNRCVSRRGGKSGLHRARCQVMPGGREPTDSATESKPPMSRHVQTGRGR